MGTECRLLAFSITNYRIAEIRGKLDRPQDHGSLLGVPKQSDRFDTGSQQIDSRVCIKVHASLGIKDDAEGIRVCKVVVGTMPACFLIASSPDGRVHLGLLSSPAGNGVEQLSRLVQLVFVSVSDGPETILRGVAQLFYEPHGRNPGPDKGGYPGTGSAHL